MQKIGFVIPWYGENIPGGAEMELREVATHLQKAGMEVEILTTCVKDYRRRNDDGQGAGQPGRTK